MKQKLLLVSAGMMLIASSALAARTAPQVTGMAWADAVAGEQNVYLYNEGMHTFLTGSKAWGTRACGFSNGKNGSGNYVAFSSVATGIWNGSISIKGYQWHIETTDETVPTYAFANKTTTNYLAADNLDGIWVDGAGDRPWSGWTVTPGEGNSIKLGYNNADWNDGGNVYFGFATVDGSVNTNTFLMKADDAAYVDQHTSWLVVSTEEYDQVIDALTMYHAQTYLLDYIASMKEKFPAVNLDQLSASAESSDLTLDQMKEIYAQVGEVVKAALVAAAANSGTYAQPYDLSALIVNGTFDAIGDFNGWSGSSFGADGTTSTCAERFQVSFDTYQDIDGLPNGVYTVNVDGFYRAGSIADDLTNFTNNTSNNSKLYGGNVTADSLYLTETSIMHLFQGIKAGDETLGGEKYEKDGLTYYVPNSMADFVKYNEAGYYKTNKVLVAVSEGKIRVGVKNASSTGWTIVDNFGLQYHGQGADAYTALMNDYKANVALGADVACTKSLAEEYNQLVNSSTATTYDEFMAATAAIAAKKAEVDENVRLWKELADLIAQSEEYTTNTKYEDADGWDDLGWEAGDAAKALDKLKLTTAELQSTINELKRLIALVASQTPADTDVSHKIVNADFSLSTGEQDWTGWVKKAADGGNVRVMPSSKCAEAWNNSGFDIYQIVRDLPAGLYEISCNGFYRYLRGNNAWGAYFNEDGTPKSTKPEVPAYIYLNDARTPMANVFEYQSPAKDSLYKGTDFYTDELVYDLNGEEVKGKYAYPNDMASAGIAFDKGAYSQSAYGLVAHQGDSIRIGMKGSSNQGGDSWAIFTRFKLIYRAYPVDKLLSELERGASSIDLSTVESDYQFVGARLAAKADSLLQVVNNLLSKAPAPKGASKDGELDGKEIARVLNEVYVLAAEIEDSRAAFKAFNEKFQSFGEQLGAYKEEARKSVYEEADQFNTTVALGLTNRTYNDEDLEGLKAQMDKYLRLLAVPATIDTANDEDPAELTGIIINNSFESDLEGWTNLGSIKAKSQNNTSFDKVGDKYAELWHVDGTVELSQTIEDLNLPEGTYQLVFKAHCSTEDGVVYANDAVVAVENTTDPANVAPQNFYFNLAENEPLTIGVKCTLTSSTWVCVDDFQLFYYGKESAHRTEVGIETLNEVAAAKVEYIDLNGRKTNGIQKGINIVRKTDAQGNVKVLKVIVK